MIALWRLLIPSLPACLDEESLPVDCRATQVREAGKVQSPRIDMFLWWLEPDVYIEEDFNDRNSGCSEP